MATQVQYDVKSLTLATTNSPQAIVGADNRRVLALSVRQLDAGVTLSLRLGTGPAFQVYQGDVIDLSTEDHRAGVFYDCIGAGKAQILISYGDTSQ